MILKTKLFGHVYEFKSIREVMAKANEEKSGDKLAGIVKSFLYFNSATDKAGRVSVETVYSDVWEKRFIRDVGIKVYEFAVVQMLPQDQGTSDINAEQAQSVQDFMTGSMSRTDHETSLNSRDVRC